MVLHEEAQKNVVLRSNKQEKIQQTKIENQQKTKNPMVCRWLSDCNLRQGASGMKIARDGSRTCFLM